MACVHLRIYILHIITYCSIEWHISTYVKIASLVFFCTANLRPIDIRLESTTLKLWCWWVPSPSPPLSLWRFHSSQLWKNCRSPWVGAKQMSSWFIYLICMRDYTINPNLSSLLCFAFEVWSLMKVLKQEINYWIYDVICGIWHTKVSYLSILILPGFPEQLPGFNPLFHATTISNFAHCRPCMAMRHISFEQHSEPNLGVHCAMASP